MISSTEIVHKFDHIIVGQRATFELDAVAFQIQAHQPDLQRIQALTDMVQHFHRAGPAFLQLIDDAVLGFELLLLFLKILYRFDLLFQLSDLLILDLLLALLGLDLVIERGATWSAPA